MSLVPARCGQFVESINTLNEPKIHENMRRAAPSFGGLPRCHATINQTCQRLNGKTRHFVNDGKPCIERGRGHSLRTTDLVVLRADGVRGVRGVTKKRGGDRPVYMVFSQPISCSVIATCALRIPPIRHAQRETERTATRNRAPGERVHTAPVWVRPGKVMSTESVHSSQI